MRVSGELHFPTENGVKVIPLDGPRLTIGRGPENQLSIPSTVISRSHAELIRIGDDFVLRDVGSTNGSYINGQRITEQILQDGDTIRFGGHGPEAVFRLSMQPTGPMGVPTPPHEGAAEPLIASLTGKLGTAPEDICEKANLHRVLAEAHLNRGEIERAHELLRPYTDPQVLEALPAAFRATMLLWLGHVYLEQKEHALAIETLARSADLYQEVNDEMGIAWTHALRGHALISTSEFTAARDHLHRALPTARRSGNSRLRAEIHLLLGKADWKEGDFEGAKYNWQRAAQFIEESEDPILLGRVKLQQALLLYSEGKLKEALPAYQEAIEQLKLTGNPRLLLKGYSSLSRVLTRLGSWSATEKLLDKRLRLARENGLAKAEAVALTDLAELKLLRGDLAAAAAGIARAIERHGSTIYARTQRILGRIRRAEGQMEQAIEALEAGLTAARRRGAIEEQVLIGLELALLLAERGDFSAAHAQVEAAESATSLDPALQLMARALYTHGFIHSRENHLTEANRCFSQSLSIFQSIADPYRTALAHGAIGRLRIRQRRLESARAHLEEAQAIFARLGAAAELHEVEKQLSSTVLADVQGAMTSVLGPISSTAKLSLSHHLSGPLSIGETATPQRILIAIASDETAGILQRGLEVENYVVEHVRGGLEAFARALKKPSEYELLILDALLEHKSGFDICRELRKQKNETPVILLGGRQGLEDKIEALQAGADDFLSKRRLVFEELQAKVEALLR